MKVFLYLNRGLLTTFVTLEYTNGKYEKFSKIGFLVSRFVRLIPLLAIFILLTTLIPLLGSGPVWNQQVMSEVKNCYNNWWQNILCLQNFIDPKNMV
jgi:peptidoglycan/LPS O-acetylase OafA/YrhL